MKTTAMVVAMLAGFGLLAASPASLMSIRVFPQSKNPVPIEAQVGAGLLELKPSTAGNGQLIAVFGVGAERKHVELAFKAGAAGRIGLTFFASRPIYGGTSVAVANISVNGKPVSNSDYAKLDKKGRPAGFRIADNAEVIPASGTTPAAVRVSFARHMTYWLNVKAGEVYRVGADLTAMAPYPGEEAPAGTAAKVRRGKSDVPGKAQIRAEFPIYDNQRIAKPEGIRDVSAADFKIDLGRVAEFDQGSFYGRPGTLTSLAKLLMTKPYDKLWQIKAERAAQVVNQWDFIRRGFATQRYISATYDLMDLSLVYAFSGNPELGKFIKMHALQVSRLPLDFWCHAELRGCNPKHPVGGLETAHLSVMMSKVLSLVGDALFSPEEKKELETALMEKGHKVTTNWLERVKPGSTVNNWAAVIATGNVFSSKYFKDETNLQRSLGIMKYYLDSTIEDDGSYGEGISYFSYPLSTLMSSFPILTKEEIREVFGESYLRHTPQWLASTYFFNKSGDNVPITMKAAFGDNGYFGKPSPTLTVTTAYLYKDRLMPYLMKRLDSPDWYSKSWGALYYSILLGLDNFDNVSSPEELKMPLLRSFDSGETVIRKSWRDNDPVLVMKRQLRSKVGYAHARPESNSIAMAAYGEYFVVLPSSASYRSPIHRDYDCSTRSANAIMVDNQDQLLTNAPGNAEVTLLEDTPEFSIAVQESAPRYAVPMRNALRAVVFIKALDTYVLIDRYAAKSGTHRYDARLHFFNRDDAAKLDDRGAGNFYLTRPLADLAVFIGGDTELEFKTAPGYMHNASRDYSPGGVNEGKPGSALELTASNREPIQNITMFTVLQPVRKNAAPVAVSLHEGVLKVGEVELKLQNGELELYGKTFRIFAE